MNEGISKNHIILFVTLFFFWLILTPSIDLAAIILGVIVSFMITYFNRELIINRKEKPIKLFRSVIKFISYLIVLIIEIVKSNIHVAKIVLSPSLPIEPHIVRVPVKAKKDIFRVMYGNSITLTPGTLTVDIIEDEYVVHALTKDAAEGLKDSILEKKVLDIEGINNG